MTQKTKKGLEIDRQTHVSYPSQIRATEILVKDSFGGIENYWIDSLIMSKKVSDNPKRFEFDNELQCEAVKEFLSRIKSEANNIIDCNKIYEEVINKFQDLAQKKEARKNE